MNNSNLNAQDEKHSTRIFWFVVWFSNVVLAGIFALIFCQIPQENRHNADMTLSFLFGAFTGISGVLVIVNPRRSKEDQTNVTTNIGNNETNNSTPTT